MSEKNLAGQRFGRWTVLDESIKTQSKKPQRKWLCRCDCGTERYVLERGLLYGGSTSCGCLTRERARESAVNDLTGKTFGELTVLRRHETNSAAGGARWVCRCTCGAEYVAAGAQLTAGRVTHCDNRSAHRDRRRSRAVDITGQSFKDLTALYPCDQRSSRGGVVWHCRCRCGQEVDVSYNDLLYSNVQSCGCRKKEHDKKLGALLIHVAGTSVDMIKSRKLPADNTTGHKGVYFINGKYTAKIVFQKKQYYLGSYDNPEDAARARREAEILLFDGTAEYYDRWQRRAACDPDWASANPVRILVGRDSAGELTVSYSPLL